MDTHGLYAAQLPLILAASFALVIALAIAPPAAAADKAPLAIKGYDPVAYFTLGKPVPGRPDIEFEWDENRYRFATARHRALFKAEPARYAPQFPNFCAMSLTRGEIVDANPEYWLVSGGKLYLFGKPVGPALFRENLAENTVRANQNEPLTRQR